MRMEGLRARMEANSSAEAVREWLKRIGDSFETRPTQKGDGSPEEIDTCALVAPGPGVYLVPQSA
jgi:hypothetical protein